MQATADTQQRILDSARELFFARSYADVGVADICEHASVKKGSFYHFYPSKQALTLAVLDAHFIDIKEKLIDIAFADDLPPLARMARFAEMAYQFQKQVSVQTGHVLGCPFGNLSAELSTQDEPIRERIQQTFAKLQKMLSCVIKAAQTSREVAPEVDVSATAQAMLAYFEGVLLMAKNQNNPELIRSLLPAMAQIRIHRI